VDASHEGAEGAVHELVLLHQRAAGESRGPDAHLEVVAGTGGIRDAHLGAGERFLDAAADILGAHHSHAGIPGPTLTQAARGPSYGADYWQSRFGSVSLLKSQTTVARGWLVAMWNALPPPVTSVVHVTPGERFTPGSSEQSPAKYVRVSR